MSCMGYYREIVIQKKMLGYPVTERVRDQVSGSGRITVRVVDALASYVKEVQQTTPDEKEMVRRMKRTLAIVPNRSGKLLDCRPSAHYQLPLVSGCPGFCEYCYLHTRCRNAPYTRLYANVDELLARAERAAGERMPETTVFEASAASDPLPVEEISGVLSRTVQFFAGKPGMRLRFATKFDCIGSLLNLDHQGHTEARFSLNTPRVAGAYEHGVPSVAARIRAAVRMQEAGYPVGFLIAPVFIYEEWKEDYKALLEEIRGQMPAGDRNPFFEIIAHRYTNTARERILQLFPDTALKMEDQERTYRFGRFGYGKFVYPKDRYREMECFFRERIESLFGPGSIRYMV